MSKKEKVAKITQLTSSVQSAGADIECLGLLHKIVVLQLNQAAIQFFKRDKFTTYNHTVNLYMQKQMENTKIKVDLFTRIQSNNQSYSQIVMQKESDDLATPQDNNDATPLLATMDLDTPQKEDTIIEGDSHTLTQTIDVY